MRLFLAIEFPEEIKKKLVTDLDLIRKKKFPLKWVNEENLHLTVKFIGEFPEKKLAGLRSAILKAINRSGFEEINLAVKGIGFFPPQGVVRVIWAGIESDLRLQKLAENLDTNLFELGIKPEDRKFVPHLTLARAKGEIKVSVIKEQLKQLIDNNYGNFQSKQIVLFRSELFSSGPKYSKIEEFSLVNSSN